MHEIVSITFFNHIFHQADNLTVKPLELTNILKGYLFLFIRISINRAHHWVREFHSSNSESEEGLDSHEVPQNLARQILECPADLTSIFFTSTKEKKPRVREREELLEGLLLFHLYL